MVSKKIANFILVARMLQFAALALLLVGSAFALAAQLPKARVASTTPASYPADLRRDMATLMQSARTFEDRQRTSGLQIVDESELHTRLSQIQLDVASGDYEHARSEIKYLHSAISGWNLQLVDGTTDMQRPQWSLSTSQFIPIVFYHYTPPDFEEQLSHLELSGYTVIDLDQAITGLQGGILPAKPVVITFDDGFEDQMKAYGILTKHHMKATFYIVNGGAKSLWCIGAGRRYGDSSQPPQGCGDGYLTWDQVRELDHSGLITIGGHTLDHENLAGDTEAEQRREIFESKAGIELQLGHPIHHFAYPYGAYTSTTIKLVREAGFTTAVTTLPGSYQDPLSEYTLRRLRDAWQLH